MTNVCVRVCVSVRVQSVYILKAIVMIHSVSGWRCTVASYQPWGQKLPQSEPSSVVLDQIFVLFTSVFILYLIEKQTFLHLVGLNQSNLL